MADKLSKPRGTQDFLPPVSDTLELIKAKIADTFRSLGYHLIETPIFEHTELFLRLGEATDIVQKEMYTFKDRKGRSLTLRPEITAPVVRALLEANLHKTSDLKRFYYIGPIFRYEKPQKGRYRQAHQFGIEVLGSSSPFIDFEVISVAMKVYESFGLKDLKVSLNSIGCKVCRPRYREALLEYLSGKVHELCDDCKVRYKRNPLRVLDCKVDRDKLRDAPKPIDYLCDDCRTHFNHLKDLLDKAGVPYEVDHHLVRGLDYYNRTVFEIRANLAGKYLELAGGGRYDYLAQEIGADEEVPGCGFAGGLERLYMILEEAGALPERSVPLVVVLPLSERARESFVAIFRELQPKKVISVAWDLNLRKGLRYADRLGADEVIFFGDRELEKGIAVIRDMRTGDQREIQLKDLRTYLESG